MRQFNCGYWVIERQLADLRRVLFCPVFVGFFVGFLLGTLAHLRRVFVLFFGACGAHLCRFLARFSWVFVGFRGFSWFFVVFGL